MSEKIEWSGVTASFMHKHTPEKPNPPDVSKGLSKKWFIDAQWTDCPIEVRDEVRLLWRLYERGNDIYIIRTNISSLKELHDSGKMVDMFNQETSKREDVRVTTSAIRQYLEENGATDPHEDIIIYYWW